VVIIHLACATGCDWERAYSPGKPRFWDTPPIMLTLGGEGLEPWIRGEFVHDLDKRFIDALGGTRLFAAVAIFPY
jgi:hypothetical protein